VVTIDAMGCQRDIARKIIEKKADYIVALKGNQGTLREDVEVFVDEQKTLKYRDTKISTHETVDADHGRIETRNYILLAVFFCVKRAAWAAIAKLLSSIKSGPVLRRHRFRSEASDKWISVFAPMLQQHRTSQNLT